MYLRKLPLKQNRSEESGFASIVIGLILVLVLGLLVVGFAQLSRHEAQEALNDQLASQAQYAAESGINDALSDIQNGYINSGDASSTICMTPSSTGLPADALTANPVINAANLVSYSCLLVNLNTPDLSFKQVSADDARTMVTSTSNPLDSLTISWQSDDGNNNYVPNGVFPELMTTNQWDTVHNYPGVLEFSITPLSNATMDRTDLDNDVFTVYAYPGKANGPASIAYNSAGGQGQIVSGLCGTAVPGTIYSCNVTITGLTNPNPDTQFLIHFLNFYDTSDVDLTGEDVHGNPVTFSGGQAQIDVTGKAKDVLKRLQVRAPLNPSSDFPNYAIEAQNICKLMETNPSNTTFIDPSGSAATPGDMCDLE